MSKFDLAATWLKGRLVSRGADTVAIVPEPMAVNVRAPNKLPAFPSQVKVIAIVKQSHFYKPARRRVKPSGRPRNWGNVENLEMDFRNATLAAVEQPYVPLPSPSTSVSTATPSGGGQKADTITYYIHASDVFLRTFMFSDGEIVWFRGAQAFPLTEVYLEHVNEGKTLSEATCEQLVQHLRGRCWQNNILAKQDSLFVCKLPSDDEDMFVLSIGSSQHRPVQPPFQRNLDQHTLLTFQVIMSAPLCQGLITMDTEINVIPSEPVDSPGNLSPDEILMPNQDGRHVGGSYHLDSGLQTRGVLSPDDDDDEEEVEESSFPASHQHLVESSVGVVERTPLSPVDLPTKMTSEGGGIGLLSPMGSQSTPSLKSATYSIEVRPFYHDGLDKNMLLVPRSITNTLSAWLGPVCSGDYLALYPADSSGARLHTGVCVEEGAKRIPTRVAPVVPYHVVVKLFTPSSDVHGPSLGNSLSSVRSDSLLSMQSQCSEEFPVMPEGEWPVVFLHPESLFSIFPGPFLSREHAPLYVSMEVSRVCVWCDVREREERRRPSVKATVLFVIFTSSSLSLLHACHAHHSSSHQVSGGLQLSYKEYLTRV